MSNNKLPSNISEDGVDIGHEYDEYLWKENYYESRGVGTRAKSDKTCIYCEKEIKKGTPHDMHHFYPEFEAYATHKNCSRPFEESLISEDEYKKRHKDDED